MLEDIKMIPIKHKSNTLGFDDAYIIIMQH